MLGLNPGGGASSVTGSVRDVSVGAGWLTSAGGAVSTTDSVATDSFMSGGK